MKKLIFKKFVGDVFKTFIIICISISLIVWVIQAVKFLDYVTEDGHSFKIYFSYTILNLPKIIHRIFPFVFFISLFYEITRYELKNELLVLWANGIKKISFINTVIIYSLLITSFQIFLGSYISPFSQNKARDFIRNSNIDFFPSLFQEGKFIDVVQNLSIFIETEKPQGIFNNIFLKEIKVNGGSASKVIYAKSGYVKNEENKRTLELIDGNVINVDSLNTNNFSFEKIDFDLTRYGSKSISIPKIQELNNGLLIKCLNYYLQDRANELIDKNFTCNKNSIKNVKQELFKRFYKPIYLPLLSLLACLIFFISKENNKFTFYRYIIFSSGIIAIVFSEISLRYSSNSILGLYFFVTFPLLIILGLYIFTYNKSKQIA